MAPSFTLGASAGNALSDPAPRHPIPLWKFGTCQAVGTAAA